MIIRTHEKLGGPAPPLKQNGGARPLLAPPVATPMAVHTCNMFSYFLTRLKPYRQPLWTRHSRIVIHFELEMRRRDQCSSNPQQNYNPCRLGPCLVRNLARHVTIELLIELYPFASAIRFPVYTSVPASPRQRFPHGRRRSKRLFEYPLRPGTL